MRMKKWKLPTVVVISISFFTSAEFRAEVLAGIEKRYQYLRERFGRFVALKYLLFKVFQTAAIAIGFHLRIALAIEALIHLLK